MILLMLMVQEGLAAKYPGDEGLENDPRVLFVEDFETGEVREIGARWGNQRFPDNMSLVGERPEGSPGKRALHITTGANGPKGSCQGGHLYTHVRPVDTMHVRFYVRFHEKHGYMHHFVSLIADRTPTPWPKGWAGKCPPGDSHFLSNIEPWSRWGKDAPLGVWNFYSYWQEMKADGRGDYWGNSFMPEEVTPIPRGQWICVEARVQANSAPDKADGEQTFWIDGKKAGHFTGIRWRSHDNLKLNSLWLNYDVDENSAKHNRDPQPETRVYEAWFDDLVVATDYIGPVTGKPKSGTKAARFERSAPVEKLPEKVLFSETFESGAGKFKAEVQEGALVLPPKAVSAWNAWTTTVGETTAVRFRVKPLADIDQLTVMVWSEKLKDNARFYVTNLKKGEWKDVRFRALEARQGWAMDGPSLEGSVFNNVTFVFEGAPEARLLIDDLEIRE
jgi:hypothetical protein